MNYLQATQEYLRDCLVRGLSQETLALYERRLHDLAETLIKGGLGKTSKDIEIGDITSSVIRYHFVLLKERMQIITLKSHYTCLHSFFAFLEKEEIISVNIMDKIDKPKINDKEIQAFSKEDIAKLLSVFDKGTFTGYRNYCITCLLFSTGLRRGEAVRIKLNDIHFDINIIKVIGKGGKFRNVPIGDTLRKVLNKYIHIRNNYVKEKSLNSSPYLFITKYTGDKMRVDALSEIYNTVGKEEGMKGVRVSPHTFRHTFAKFFLLNGGDIFSLQKIMGHSDISMTKKYVNLNINDIRVQNDKYNPLDNESWRYL